MSTAIHLLSLWAFMVCSRLNLVCHYFKICNMLQWIWKEVIVTLQEILSHLPERTVESREDHHSSRYSGQDSK